MLNKYLHQFSNLHCNKLKGEIAPQPFWRLVPFSGGDDTIEMLSKSNPYSAGTIRKFIRHAEIDNELISFLFFTAKKRNRKSSPLRINTLKL